MTRSAYGILIWVLSLIIPLSAFAQFEGYNHPELNWKTLETEHFFIHFHQNMDWTPYMVAEIAESIFEPVTQLYQFIPDEKVHLIFQDTDDVSGGATYYYDNKILISATPMDFALRGTSNWLHNVITHEFAHMIHLQRARKLVRNVPAAFIQWLGYEREKRDDVVYGFPNVLVSYPIAMTIIPNWFAEGVAQYTAMKFGYDHWDPHRDMIIRMRVLHDELLSMDAMGSFGKNSIGNESVYNQGFSLVQYIAEHHGEEALEKLTRTMQKYRYVTFNMSVKKVLGITEDELYERWKKSLGDYYSGSIRTVAEHEQAGTIVESEGFANLYPAWSPDGSHYAFLSNRGTDYLSMTSLYLGGTSGGKPERIASGIYHTPSWFPDGSGLVFVKMEQEKNGSHIKDLYLYELRTKETRRLTRGQRAFYPAVSPDGAHIAFATVADGIFNLCLYDTRSGEIKKLTDFSDGRQIFKISWTPDSGEIIFSCTQTSSQKVAAISADGSNFRYIIDGKYDYRDPEVSADGAYIYYSSNRTGIFNIYRMNYSNGTQELVSNVQGGAFMPSVSSNGNLLYTQYTNKGYLLSVIENPAAIDTSLARYINYDPPDPLFQKREEPSPEAKPYKTMYASTTVMPRIMMDYKRPKLGVTAYSSDYMEKYSFLGAVAANSILDYDAYLEFMYKKYRPTLFLNIYGISRRLRTIFPANAELNQPAEHDEIRFSLIEVDLGATMRLNDTQTVTGMFAYSKYRSSIKSLDPIPGIPNRTFGYDYFIGKKFDLEWRYLAEGRRIDSDINPSAGRDLSVRIAREDNEFITDFAFNERIGSYQEVYKPYLYHSLYVNWKEYYPLPVGIDRNALNLNIQTGLIDRSVDSFFHFFAGGLPGIKGYSYYSIEGRKMLIGTLTYRAPIFQDIDWGWGPWYFNKLYGGVSYFWGNAWSQQDIPWNEFKKSIDFQIRVDAFSFYNFPTKIAFDAAYSFDEFTALDIRHGREWRFYVQILFDYLF